MEDEDEDMSRRLRTDTNRVRMLHLTTGTHTVTPYNEERVQHPLDYLQYVWNDIFPHLVTFNDAMKMMEALHVTKATYILMAARDNVELCQLVLNIVERLLQLCAKPQMIQLLVNHGCFMSLKSCLDVTGNEDQLLDILHITYNHASNPVQLNMVVSQTIHAVKGVISMAANPHQFRKASLILHIAVQRCDVDVHETIRHLCHVFSANLADTASASDLVFQCCEAVQDMDLARHVLDDAKSYVELYSGSVLLDAARSMAFYDVTDDVVAAGLLLLRYGHLEMRWPEVMSCLRPEPCIVERAIAMVDERVRLDPVYQPQPMMIVSRVAAVVTGLSVKTRTVILSYIYRYVEYGVVVPSEVVQALRRWSMVDMYLPVYKLVSESQKMKRQLCNMNDNNAQDLLEMI